MKPTKGEIKDWLKTHGHSREWLGRQCGGVSKRAVDNWLSSDREIPSSQLFIIARLIADDAKAQEVFNKSTEPHPQNLVLEVDIPTFERWSRAALSHGEIITEYATRVIEEAAAADLEIPLLRAAEDAPKYEPPPKQQAGGK